MKKMKLATSAFALGALALSASADTETTLWSVNFNGMTAAWDVPNQESETDWTISGAGTFTRTQDDNSKVVGTYKEVSLSSDALELNTEGNELVFAPATAPSGDKTVVDADIFFIASDTNPNITEGSNPVQAALYLYADENATPELRAYTYTTGGNIWTNLDYTITDNVSTGIWLHVSIAYDGTDVTYTIGEGANQTSTTLNRANSNVAGSFNEVVFKGTGLVDNFTGKSVTVDTVSYTYSASVETGTLEDGVVLDNVTGNTAQFQISLLDDNAAPLSRIEVLGTNGVARTVTVEVDTSDVDPVATFTEDGDDTTGIGDLELFGVDISEFLESGEPDGTEFTVLKLYYTAAGGEEAWGDDPAKDQTQLDNDLADGFAAVVSAGEAPVEFDAQDGFTVKFVPTTPGTYSLVAAASPDADFDTENGDGHEVANQTVDATDIANGVPVELSDDETTGQNVPAARFYKIKVRGYKE